MPCLTYIILILAILKAINSTESLSKINLINLININIGEIHLKFKIKNFGTYKG